MREIAEFQKVSFEEFRKEYMKAFPGTGDSVILEAYENLRLPRRATAGSAGYDFFLPCGIALAKGESVRVPTGIRARMDEGWVLLLFPRSGLGCRYRLQLDNTVGVIDGDYYGSDNEGHILVFISNDSNKGEALALEAGSAFVQGVFLPFGAAKGDEASARRNGGLGSTSDTGAVQAK